MRGVFAIALLAVRAAIRSRVVLTLLALLLLAILALPATIKSDGTLAGYVQLLLVYTLGAVFALLSLASVWAGCAAVAAEIESRQIQLIMTKPVHRAQIWLGKWLGLMAVNFALLAFSGIITYTLLFGSLRRMNLSDAERTVLREELLVARIPVRPPAPQLETAVWRERLARRARGGEPAARDEAEALREIRARLLAESCAVPPGESRQWRFTVPDRLISEEHPLLVRYKLSSSRLGSGTLTGRWVFRDAAGQVLWETETHAAPGVIRSFMAPTAVAQAAGNGLTVEYHNIGAESGTVMFNPEDGLILLFHRGGLAANFIRALAILFMRLALLVALGVTAGCLFSMPVAVFISMFALALINAGGFIQGVIAEQAPGTELQATPTSWTAASLMLYRLLGHLLRPLQTGDPLELLSTGVMVSGADVLQALLIQALAYAFLIAAVGVWGFGRREVGLPTL